jgi:hypothetical protein
MFDLYDGLELEFGSSSLFAWYGRDILRCQGNFLNTLGVT